MVPSSYGNAPELPHDRLESLLILLQQRIELLILVLKLLILEDEV